MYVRNRPTFFTPDLSRKRTVRPAPDDPASPSKRSTEHIQDEEFYDFFDQLQAVCGAFCNGAQTTFF